MTTSSKLAIIEEAGACGDECAAFPADGRLHAYIKLHGLTATDPHWDAFERLLKMATSILNSSSGLPTVAGMGQLAVLYEKVYGIHVTTKETT